MFQLLELKRIKDMAKKAAKKPIRRKKLRKKQARRPRVPATKPPEEDNDLPPWDPSVPVGDDDDE
jgi:chromatin segregation and condensation protein Rec8/ScpA/Scc1 (kleisin family)